MLSEKNVHVDERCSSSNEEKKYHFLFLYKMPVRPSEKKSRPLKWREAKLNAIVRSCQIRNKIKCFAPLS